MKIAVPKMGDLIAPCFEAATSFVIAVTQIDGMTSVQTIRCVGEEGYRRIRLLRLHGVEVLICNGIKTHYADMLTASGTAVTSKVTGSVSKALEDYLAGRLVVTPAETDDSHAVAKVHHNELVSFARQLFTNHGYAVSDGPGQDAFLVDLVAQMTCPVCDKPVRVAICCGAHTYRASVEITEFHHSTAADYHARVYVCPASPGVRQCCQSYRIQMIDPDQLAIEPNEKTASPIPLLQRPIRGHERIAQ